MVQPVIFFRPSSKPSMERGQTLSSCLQSLHDWTTCTLVINTSRQLTKTCQVIGVYRHLIQVILQKIWSDFFFHVYIVQSLMQVSLIKEYTKTRCLSFVTSIVYPFPKCISMFRLIFLSNLSELTVANTPLLPKRNQIERER